MPEPRFHIFPIRHHGPGSARSLLRALDALKPDCVLLEGPPDADELLFLAAEEAMKPPIALLVHAADNPAEAVYYPFARFSPEWNAIRWAQQNGVPARFIDLPQFHRLAQEREMKKPDDATQTPQEIRRDPLAALAEVAGFDDSERWWEHLVEHRRAAGGDADVAVFNAITDAIAALREDESFATKEDLLREAHMRREMRGAAKEHTNIAIVCGAFHAPVLRDPQTKKKEDDAALKSLPKIKTSATWVPWTHQLLTTASGYGAGVRSPGWYDHVFSHDTLVLERWMTRIAHLLRGEDIDCSSAHVIESVRLAGALSTMRARPLADLTDIADAARSVFCHDSDSPMRLIARKLLVGDALGEVPATAPQVPLQQDLNKQQKSLRLKPEALEKKIDLDLRNETDLARSHLLHRLILLGVNWGTLSVGGGREKGTFKESWALRWDPHFVVRIIAAARFGNTVADAATGLVKQKLAESPDDLPALAKLLDTLILSDLESALDSLLHRIDTVAAVAADVGALMDALPPLVRAARYGTVRQTDSALLRRTVAGILPRITAGLPLAVANVNDELAEMFVARMLSVHEAITLLARDVPDLDAGWFETLRHLKGDPQIHGEIQGKASRLLFDASKITAADVAADMSLALSRGADPARAAGWLGGFLQGSGLVLIHDPKLLAVIDSWVAEIQQDAFEAVLPLLRRTFSTFAVPERRQIGAKLAQGATSITAAPDTDAGLDPERANRVLPVLREIFGVTK